MYTTNMTLCGRSCKDPIGTDCGIAASPIPLDGCDCPQDEVDNNGVCVPLAQCP